MPYLRPVPGQNNCLIIKTRDLMSVCSGYVPHGSVSVFAPDILFSNPFIIFLVVLCYTSAQIPLDISCLCPGGFSSHCQCTHVLVQNHQNFLQVFPCACSELPEFSLNCQSFVLNCRSLF